MNKIIFGIIIATILAGGIFWFVHSNKSTELTQQNSSTTVTFPIDQPTNQQEVVPKDERFRKKFNEFLTSEQTAEANIRFTDNGQIVPLNDMLSILGAHIQPNLQSLLNDNNWQLYTCTNTTRKDGVRDIILSLSFSVQDAYQGNLHKDQVQYLSLWEHTLLKDVTPILFPTYYYNSAPTQSGPFVDIGRYIHRAPIQFSENSSGMIGYILIGDELLVGTSEECLHKTQEILFDTTS